jgi:hypothetical protein
VNFKTITELFWGLLLFLLYLSQPWIFSLSAAHPKFWGLYSVSKETGLQEIYTETSSYHHDLKLSLFRQGQPVNTALLLWLTVSCHDWGGLRCFRLPGQIHSIINCINRRNTQCKHTEVRRKVKVNVKVKLFLSLTKHHAMKAYWVVEV